MEEQMESSIMPASLVVLYSLLSLPLKRGEGRECWKFLLSSVESLFALRDPTKAGVTRLVQHMLFSQPTG